VTLAVDDTTAEQRRELLRSMLLQRRFEERCAEAYALGRIGGFCHLYIGQEAVGAGAIAALREDDYIITTYRDHGQAIARGIAPRAIMAELFGRSDGCARGKGGSMHRFDRSLNFLGVATGSWVATYRWPPASASRSSTAAPTRSASASWASRW
jgi:pyruvate dehydrogenase E1 component alpha subunit